MIISATIFSTSYGLGTLKTVPLDYKLTENRAEVFQPVSFRQTNEIVNSRLHTFEEIVKFKIDPTEIGSKIGGCAESNDFILSGISWKVKVCITDELLSNDAIVELVSNLIGDTETWSCQAEATVKLLSPQKTGKPHKGELKSFTHSKAEPSNSLKKFIKWDVMKKKYLMNGVATFEFDIKTKIPNRSPKSEQYTTKFQVRAKQVRSLGEQYSNEVVVHGIRWRVLTSKMQDNFAVFICANENDTDITKSWKVSATIKLLSADKDKSISKPVPETTIDWTQTKLGHTDFMKWDEFTNKEKKYVQNNAALLEIELTVHINSNSKL